MASSVLAPQSRSAPSRLTWLLAFIIIAMQLAFSAGLYWVNFLTEDIPGRQVSHLTVAQSPQPGYVALPSGAFEPVVIPREECCENNAVIYRTHLTPADAALRYPAVLIVSAHDNALIYIDGQLVAGQGRAEGPPPQFGRRPQLLRIPSALARPGAALDVVVLRATGFGHLRPFHIGEYDGLYNSFLMLRLLRNDLPFANAIIAVFVAIFCFCAAPLFGARALLFSLGSLAAAWAGQQVGMLLTEPPWGASANNAIYLISYLATLACLAWFFIEWTSALSREKHAPTRRNKAIAALLDPWDSESRRMLVLAVLGVIVIGSGLIMARVAARSIIGVQEADRLLGYSALLVLTLCLIRIVAFYWRSGFRDPIEAAAFLFVIVAALADISLVRFFHTYGVFIGTAVVFFPLALLVSLAARARDVFEAATATADKLNTIVDLREQEIRATMAELQRRERATMLVEERSRIMRDMHDGIGSQLIGLILQARSRKLSDHALVSGLEQSLDDLRLVVDSLEQGEGSLTGAIGAFRARIEPRCEAADVTLEWRIEDVGPTPSIGPDKTLQIYRILSEACTNALKHAAPKAISVSLRRVGDEIEIALANDGNAWDPATATAGRGLTNMRARAQRIGAAIEIAALEAGSRVTLRLGA